MYYHGTTINGIKIMEPKQDCLGSRLFVFATPNFVSAVRHITHEKTNLLFGIINGKAVIVEKFKGAFEKSYANVSGYVYVLPEEPFNLTNLGNRREYVSSVPVRISETIYIENALDKLLQAKEKDLLTLYRYPDFPKGFSAVGENVLERLKRKLCISIKSLRSL